MRDCESHVSIAVLAQSMSYCRQQFCPWKTTIRRGKSSKVTTLASIWDDIWLNTNTPFVISATIKQKNSALKLLVGLWAAHY